MSEAIANSGMTRILGCFLDDLATGGANHQEAAANTGRKLAMLKSARLLAGADKVFTGLEEIPFLGFLLRAGQLLPDPDKVRAVQALLPPTTRTELRGFLGLVGYYREFIARFSVLARPLTTLLKEDVPWEWSPACQEAFETL